MAAGGAGQARGARSPAQRSSARAAVQLQQESQGLDWDRGPTAPPLVRQPEPMGMWSLLWAFPGFCLQNGVGELSPQGGVWAWAWSWWPLAPLSSGVAWSTASIGTDPSLRTVFSDGVTPASLRDRDDAPDGGKPLPLGGCSRPELGAVCVGAGPILCGESAQSSWAGRSGWGRWRTEASRAWGGTGGRAEHCQDPTGPHKPQAPGGH